MRNKKVEPHLKVDPHLEVIHPEFEALVNGVIQKIKKDELANLRQDFHSRLRLTLTHPDDSELIQDLWDFFYDWCVFEKKLPDQVWASTTDQHQAWQRMNENGNRGLYSVARSGRDELRLKELFLDKTFIVHKVHNNDFIGISKGDILEGRLIGNGNGFVFVRRPSYHPAEVRGYLKKKVKQFKKSKDQITYQSWLWLLVGMYLKHRIYQHMPVEKIYDDNSRI